MFWWIEPLLLSLAVLFLIDTIVCTFLITIDAKSKIIKFFMDTLYALVSVMCIFIVLVIIYKIWIEYLPA